MYEGTKVMWVGEMVLYSVLLYLSLPHPLVGSPPAGRQLEETINHIQHVCWHRGFHHSNGEVTKLAMDHYTIISPNFHCESSSISTSVGTGIPLPWQRVNNGELFSQN